ncbi:threonine--tRNA ligase, partial [bacterium]|nr:threonine--tRNA ligase [bacterium]
MQQRTSQDLLALRHSAEHVLHQAIKELYPSIRLAMGPATNEGFYCDFEGDNVTLANFDKIEKRMRELIKRNLPITRHEISVKEARELFIDNPYKLEWIDEIEGKGEKVTIYWTGNPKEKGSMVDLCKGPHVSSTGEIKAFKLLSVAGAYWHGDEKNKMLTRIYGTAFPTQAELTAYVEMQAEAKKRDHRKLGKELELFLLNPSVGAGFPLYMPNGWLLRHALEDWIISEKQKRGYSFVWTPHVAKSDLYKQSGHWQKYDAMMSPMKIDDEEYVVKPMNCPHHFQ